MAETKIEWAERVWNPVVGCRKVSEGCRNCYAEKMAQRIQNMGNADYDSSVVKDWHWTGHVKLLPERLDDPLRWKKPARVFVNSMSDLFHEEVPFDFIDQVMACIRLSKQHKFIVLTKRPDRMLDYFNHTNSAGAHVSVLINWEEAHTFGGRLSSEWPIGNLWLGVSVEDQKTADERIPILLQTPAAVRFISVEPMLGPVDLGGPFDIKGPKNYDWSNPEDPDAWLDGIRWVICGGESGPNARPMEPGWARNLRDQCVDGGVSFFFKQWGEWIVREQWIMGGRSLGDVPNRAYVNAKPCGNTQMYCVGKKAAGNLLDGKVWNQFPGGE